MSLIQERVTARVKGPTVVFLIGMRINKPWMIHKWLPVMLAMPKMLIELSQKPELGLLWYKTWFGRNIITVQYWESVEKLMEYAKNRDAQHLPAWKKFNQAIGASGQVGIWHETYVIQEGSYENVYVNMPPFGLGATTELIPATGHLSAASKRISNSQKD
jgi:hypothetical protein